MTERTTPTVRGQRTVGALGRTLMHEHVFVLTKEVLDNVPGLWDEERYVAEAIEQLNALHAAGVSTIVDPTIVGLGRYIPRIQRVASGTDVNIIVGTGVYAFAEMPHFFHYRGPGTMIGGPEPITQLLIDDVREGIGGTRVRAGFIKIAMEYAEVTADVERILAATVEAHLETGAPILTHSNATARTGRIQQDYFAARGVDLSGVVIGHVGDTTDLDYLMELADRGSILGMDRFGYTPFLSTEKRVDTIRRLCERGYSDRIVLSHDSACFTDLFPPEERAVHLPDLDYLFIPTRVVPMLLEAGVSPAQIDDMLINNPRRFFDVEIH